MLRADALLKMHRAERHVVIRQVLLLSIDELLERDLEPIVFGAHEQTICHRLAVYLERHTDLNVDCEYNRNITDEKRLADGKRFRPDIIMHRRSSNRENALAVEVKMRGGTLASDTIRLRELTRERTQFDYWAGAVIIFFNQRRALIRDGTLRVTIDWFPQSSEQPLSKRECVVPSGWILKLKEIGLLKSNSAATRRHTLDPDGT